MKSMHKFTPDQVVPMEERALLSAAFPHRLGPVTKLNFRGAFVLTSRAYDECAVHDQHGHHGIREQRHPPLQAGQAGIPPATPSSQEKPGCTPDLTR